MVCVWLMCDKVLPMLSLPIVRLEHHSTSILRGNVLHLSILMKVCELGHSCEVEEVTCINRY